MNRRQLLAAAVATPALAVVPAIASASGPSWQALAVAALDQVEFWLLVQSRLPQGFTATMRVASLEYIRMTPDHPDWWTWVDVQPVDDRYSPVNARYHFATGFNPNLPETMSDQASYQVRRVLERCRNPPWHLLNPANKRLTSTVPLS